MTLTIQSIDSSIPMTQLSGRRSAADGAIFLDLNINAGVDGN